MRVIGANVLFSPVPPASFDPTAINDDRCDRDRLLVFGEADIRAFDDMFYQINTRLDTISIYVEDIQVVKNTIFDTVGSQYAKEMSGSAASLPEAVLMRYTLASAILAGLYISQGPNASQADILTILKERTFRRHHDLFKADEQAFITSHVQGITAAVSSMTLPEAITQRADHDLQQALDDSVRQRRHPLVALALQAMQVGATIENPDLANRHFADFLAAPPRVS